MKLRRNLCLIMTILMVAGCALGLTGCDNKEDAPTSTTPAPTTATQPATSITTLTVEDVVRPEVNPTTKHDTEHKIGYQLEMPQDGEEIAILHTSMGDITWRFFPENAPKAVENFITLAKDGKYNNTIFHRVIKDFMLQAGDYENSDGTGGTSAFGEAFEDEFCDTLYNIRGSVAMANSGVNTNGSQFFINQAGPEKFDRTTIPEYDSTYVTYGNYYYQYASMYGEEFVTYYPDVDSFITGYMGGIYPLNYAISEDVYALYEENGGNIHLDGPLRASGGHTVFAQVIEGMDVVDAIAAVETNDSDKPLTDVILESVEITTYTAQ